MMRIELQKHPRQVGQAKIQGMVFPLLMTAALLLSATISHAQYPIQNMGANRLAVAYDLTAAGQNITNSNTPSQATSHQLKLAYAPIPYAGICLGLGATRFETRSSATANDFQGRFGFSPSLSIRLASPGFINDFVRITTSAETQYFSSEDVNHLNYSGFVIEPDLGLILSPFNFFDVHLGGKLHVINGNMDQRNGPSDLAFSNETIARGYIGATLKTPAEGAFLSFELDLSPKADANWSHGPVESTIHLSMGTVLGWKSREPKASPRNPYFPDYRNLKDRQDEMSTEMQTD